MSETSLSVPSSPREKPPAVGRWSEILPELLDIIAGDLTNYVDCLRAGAVCSSWRTVIRKRSYKLLTRTPWLLLPEFNRSNNTFSDTYCKFFNVAESKEYRLELPEILGEGKRCWGSPNGWLVVLQGRCLSFSLLNPLTRYQIQLPSLFFFPSPPHHPILLPWDYIGYLRNSCIQRAVLIADQSVRTGFIVVVILIGKPRGLAFFRSGSKAWTLVTEPEKIVFHDVASFQGEIYAVDKDGNVYICFLSDSPKIIKIADSPEILLAPKYLVGSDRALFVIYLHLVPAIGTTSDQKYECTVHKLDLSKLTWSKVSDLEDQALFLGSNCSLSLSAKDLHCCRRNSIHFVDEITVEDLGVFNLDDGSVEVLPSCQFTVPDHMGVFTPAWITFTQKTTNLGEVEAPLA